MNMQRTRNSTGRQETSIYPICVILGDSTYCKSKIRTEQVVKGGNPKIQCVRERLRGVCWQQMHIQYVKDTSDHEKLYSLDVFGVEDRGQDDQLQIYEDFRENIVRRDDGRYEVNVLWIPARELSGTNEQAIRVRILNVERKLRFWTAREVWGDS